MNIEVVYGCPCSGKSTYVQQNAKENDIVYDYDKLLTALSVNENHSEIKQPGHGIVLKIRETILRELKKDSDINTFYLITRWPTDYVKTMLKGFDVKYHYVETTKKDCLDRLENDERRKNKNAWKEIIETWFKEYGGEKRSTYHMKEKRIAEIRAETRATTSPAGGDNSLLIVGMPIVFDQPTIINDPAGSYTEIIRRGALDDCDLSDTRLLYNHDLSKIPLAKTPKTMQFKLDPAGLTMSATLPDTEEARSVHTAVKRGDLSGMSFAFKVPAGGDRYDPATNTREILKIEKVYEVSILPFPAYPTTSVEARTAIQEDKTKEAIKIMVNKIIFKGEI